LTSLDLPSSPAPGAPPISRIVLTPKSGWQAIDLAQLWHYRELCWILAMRDIRVRYKQTVLGVAWAIIQPFVSMIVFTVFFAGIGKLPTDGMPAPLFYFSGLLPWTLFANSLTQAGNSLIGNQNLITKVYFPRLVIPIAAVAGGLVDFAIALAMLVPIMAWYNVVPGPQIFLLPLFVLMALLASLAVGLWLSAMNVEFRDIRYVIPFLTQFWFFITPIVIPSSDFSPRMKILVGLNPMSGVVEGFRWCLRNGTPVAPIPFLTRAPVASPGAMTLVSGLVIVLSLIGGAFYFRRMEKTFADLV
jgi:lipopolysaccharide transport system permease protein